MKRLISICLILGLIMGLVGCGSPKPTEGEVIPSDATDAKTGEDGSELTSATGDLVIYCPHPLEFINPLVSEFESQTDIKVEVIAAGTGELLKRVESEQANPLGDIFWGGSLSTMEPQMTLFENYQSANEEFVQESMKNVEGPLTRFTDIPSVLMINTDLIGDIEINGYEDLLNPALKGKIAHCDPSKSSSSYEHLINILYAMGDGDPDKGWDYVDKFCENLDGKLLSGSSAVYKGVADGEYVVGLTFEEGGAKYVADGAPVKLVYMEEGVISKPDGVYIIKNAQNMQNAKIFIDFITSKDAQTIIVEQLNRRSVRTDVPAPSYMTQKEDMNIIFDNQELVVSKKEEWITKFNDIFTSK
ncbi:MAG: ABC transporter substrate-binding protein [Firmicutes bacterium HGW-Firmicutes-7]|nr:MAG: ABC transporter substrate-binding protein [Firmicutes bacterium HGW-Firmicutes-7]